MGPTPNDSPVEMSGWTVATAPDEYEVREYSGYVTDGLVDGPGEFWSDVQGAFEPLLEDDPDLCEFGDVYGAAISIERVRPGDDSEQYEDVSPGYAFYTRAAVLPSVRDELLHEAWDRARGKYIDDLEEIQAEREPIDEEERERRESEVDEVREALREKGVEMGGGE